MDEFDEDHSLSRQRFQLSKPYLLNQFQVDPAVLIRIATLRSGRDHMLDPSIAVYFRRNLHLVVAETHLSSKCLSLAFAHLSQLGDWFVAQEDCCSLIKSRRCERASGIA
jgi:hypothetical protein